MAENPKIDDRIARSNLAQRKIYLGDVKVEHGFHDETSCSRSERLDIWIEKLKNVYSSIMKENV